MTYEVQKFVATNQPVETVKYNIPTYEEGVKSLMNFARNNPAYVYRLIKIEIDFIKVTPPSLLAEEMTKENIFKNASEDELFALFHTFKEYHNELVLPKWHILDADIGKLIKQLKEVYK